jgi:6-phosphogluconate dehydrogenase
MLASAALYGLGNALLYLCCVPEELETMRRDLSNGDFSLFTYSWHCSLYTLCTHMYNQTVTGRTLVDVYRSGCIIRAEWLWQMVVEVRR